MIMTTSSTIVQLFVFLLVLLDQCSIFAIDHDIRSPAEMMSYPSPDHHQPPSSSSLGRREHSRRVDDELTGNRADVRRPETHGQKKYSVSRSVKEMRQHQLLGQVMTRRAERLRAIKQQRQRNAMYGREHNTGDDQEPGSRETERMLLSNDNGLERASVIVVPVEHPRVLTAQTFVTAGEKLGRRIGAVQAEQPVSSSSRRVQGEANGNNGGKVDTANEANDALDGRHSKTEELPSDQVAKLRAIDKKKAEEVAIGDIGSDAESTGRIRFPAEQWQLPPALLASRLRRFNKAEIMKSLREAKWKGKHIDRDKLEELLSKIEALERRSKGKETPQVSFLIDDEPNYQNVENDGKKPKLRTKYPKNHESAEPVGLGKIDESDMDLLHPPDSTLSKPRQRIAGEGHHSPPPRPPLALPLPPPLLAPSLPHRPPQPVPLPPVLPDLGVPTLTLMTRHGHHHRPHRPKAVPVGSVTVSAVTTTPSQLNPNAKLELCCRKQQLPSSCLNFCNFDTFTQEKLLVALLGTQCPSAQLSKAFDCATSKVDHSECCRRAGIDRIHDGQCMVFCRTHIKTPPNVSGYVSCLSSFGTIKNCYRDHQLRHRNLFGD